MIKVAGRGLTDDSPRYIEEDKAFELLKQYQEQLDRCSTSVGKQLVKAKIKSLKAKLAAAGVHSL